MVVRRVGLYALLALVAAAVTLLFNLFGAISVCVLAGMMTGTGRRWNWNAIGISLVPPLVVLAIGYVTKVDLDLRRCLYLTGICLLSFWGVWLATFLLMFLEQREASQPAQAVATRAAMPGGLVAPEVASDPDGLTGQVEASDFEGTWKCETSLLNPVIKTKQLVIEQGRFSLSFVSTRNRSRLVAQGKLVLQNLPESPRLTLTPQFVDETLGI